MAIEINYRTDLNKLLPDDAVTVEVGVAEGNFSEHILNNWMPESGRMKRTS